MTAPSQANDLMPRIQQLPPTVITKIAAGEVIERPASVIKELLENAVDAGSSRIFVEVDQGGTELMRVVDDGCGIQPDDLPLAFASHATSKLTSADDLFRIGTLGFRGEALASIGSVGQVTLQSRTHDRPEGAELTCHGGELSPVRPWNGSAGTRIEVRHLFYNTPVRRKFLKTTPTELGHISEIFTRIALAHPNLHLTLRHNGKQVYEVPTTATLLDRIGLFFGKDVRERLYEFEAAGGPVKLRGYLGDPACERGTAKMQYLFLNGRWIRDRSLMHALQEGYRGLIMTGRYAVAFLFLEVPPDLVDVNVHPTKCEVRFRDGHALYHLLFTSIRQRLQKQNLVPKFQLGRVQEPGSQESGIRGQESGNQESASPEPGGRLAGMNDLATPWTLRQPAPGPAPVLPLMDRALAPMPTEAVAVAEESEPVVLEPIPSAPIVAEARSVDKFMQLHDAYLVMETPEGMLVIDQHALHERILFEQIKRKLREGPLEKQRLLIPEPVDLTADQAARVLDQRVALAELGLEVEDFGGGTVLLSSYPAILGRKPPIEIFRAVVDQLVSKERVPAREQVLNDLMAVMACRAAVKAGDHLTPEEIAELIALRDLSENSHHCPHGRPTTLLVSRHDLDRQFRRT